MLMAYVCANVTGQVIDARPMRDRVRGYVMVALGLVLANVISASSTAIVTSTQIVFVICIGAKGTVSIT